MEQKQNLLSYDWWSRVALNQIGAKIRPSVKWTVTGDLKWLDWDF